MSVATAEIAVKNQAHRQRQADPRPVLLLTISNGAAHTQAAEAIADALRKRSPQFPPKVVDVANFMSRLGRFTHVTAYLWLVKNAPAVWEKIDAYQKKQTQTSPDWFYRRQCQKLFAFAGKMQPSAIVATEVGCCEIAALIKKDLKLDVPLIAVNLDYDADLAWLQPEVDFYSVAADFVKTNLSKLGAPPEKIMVLGAPLKAQFGSLNPTERASQRAKVCAELGFDAARPIVLVAGGGEGLGKIEQTVENLLTIQAAPQIIVFAGNNSELKRRCEKIARKAQTSARLCILGWTGKIAEFYQTADLLISKFGLTFFEAIACALPIVALEPPPGAERAQFGLLEEFGVGRAVRSLEEMARVVDELLLANGQQELIEMRCNAAKLRQTNAAPQIAEWIAEKLSVE